MSMQTCPDCLGCGTVVAEQRRSSEYCHHTWCRNCYGHGYVRTPEPDDEHDDADLWWPESIRWRTSA